MMIFFFALLISTSLSELVEQPADGNQKNEDQINFKLVKLDIRINGNNSTNWLENFIQSHISQNLQEEPTSSSNPLQTSSSNTLPFEIEVQNGTTDKPQVDSQEPQVEGEQIFLINLQNIMNRLDNISTKLQAMENVCEKESCKTTSVSVSGNIQIDINNLCKTMVGISKPPYCQLLEDNNLNNINTAPGNIPKTCKEIQEKGQNKSGIYEIQPTNSPKPFEVLCDMDTRGGGWTVILNRYDGSEDFYREWREYKHGFGNLNREFWIGLEHIYHITGSEISEVLNEITDRDQIKAYANYNRFRVGSEIEGYPLSNISGYSGDAGDSFTYHLGAKFTTKDMDQDTYGPNCAQSFLSAWWYKACGQVQLTGKYINLPLPVQYKWMGLHWQGYRGLEYCHAGARMLIRPANS